MTSLAIDQTVSVFRSWLHMEDADSLLATLGAVAANNLEGDPVWLLLVGPPGGGKSEILTSLNGLPYTRSAATLTEASLLSGVPKKEVASTSKGGLLREIGDFGIVVAKDFGSILSMNRDARALVLAALREIYDGSWTRLVGSDGGRALHWEGKVGFVGGVTPTIDRHHGVMGAMGERFLLYRFPQVDPDVQARRALEHAGREKRMREDLSAAVTTVLNSASKSPRHLSEEETVRLISIGTLVVRSRSAVERDGFSRDIELVPDPEAPTRFLISLSRLLIGLDAIGVSTSDAWRVLTKVAMDSIPALRKSIMDALLQHQDDHVSTTDLATLVRYPSVTTRRSCEDLTAHGLLECHPQGEGKAHLWSLTTFASQRLQTAYDGFETVSNPAPELKNETSPEMSPPMCSGSLNTYTDVSGKVTANGSSHEDLLVWLDREGWKLDPAERAAILMDHYSITTDDELTVIDDIANRIATDKEPFA